MRVSKSGPLHEMFMMAGTHFIDCFTIVDMTPARLCLFVNEVFCRQTGYTAAEVRGRNLSLLQGPETDPALVATMRDSLDQRAAFCGDLVNYRKDGSRFINRLVLLPIEASDESFFLGFQNPVTRTAEKLKDVSHGEINHMLNNPLGALVLNVEDALAAGEDVDARLDDCMTIFSRINDFCRHLDQPERFSGYNPFRTVTSDSS